MTPEFCVEALSDKRRRDLDKSRRRNAFVKSIAVFQVLAPGGWATPTSPLESAKGRVRP